MPIPTPPLICVATHHDSITELLGDSEFLALANRDGFLIELRLDYFRDLNDASLERALNAFAPGVLATFRHPGEGGKNVKANDAGRLRMLQRAVDQGVKFVDIEAQTQRGKFNKRGARLILSHHDFHHAPGGNEFKRTLAAMRAQDGVDIVKAAVTPKTIFDTLPLLEQLRADGPRCIMLGMGEAGLWTRVLAGKFGSPLTYARGENAPGTAPGQLTWRQLDELYRFRQIGALWPVYGVIGSPIAHSLSPLMHNTALQALALDGVYLPFKVDGDPAEFTRAFEALGLRGLSVTIPHKERVALACQSIDPIAQKIGAVNTLVWNPEHGIAGFNTDAEAAASSLEAQLGALADKKILILGAGGAARAVAFGVKARGAQVYICNRTQHRAATLAREVGAAAVSDDQIAGLQPDAIVNTTPIGMSPNIAASPLQESQLPKSGLVFDTVYNPLRTRLLEMAQAHGCKTLEGLEMFVEQGARQLELWTGHTAPRNLMRRVVLDALLKRQKTE